MRHFLAILLVIGCAHRPAPQLWSPYWIASPAERRWHEALEEPERQAIYEAVLEATPRIMEWRGKSLTGLVLDARISASVWLTRSDEPPRQGNFEWNGAHSDAWLAKLKNTKAVAGVCHLDLPPGTCFGATPEVAVLLSVIAPYGRAQEAVVVRVHAATMSGSNAVEAAGWDVFLTRDLGRWRVTYESQNYHTFGW